MLVEMTKLNNGTQSGYKHSEDAELYTAKHILARRFGLVADSAVITEGFDNRWDVTLSNFVGREITFELKFTRCKDFNGIPIEYARWNGERSGIMVCKADYYVICSRGNKTLGKIRLYRMDSLRQLIKTRLHYELDKNDIQNDVNDLHKVYPPNKGSPGSRNVIFKPKADEDAVSQVWIGDIDYNDTKKTYDLDSFSKSMDGIFQDQMMELLGRVTL